MMNQIPSIRELRWWGPLGLLCLLSPTFLPKEIYTGGFNPLHWSLSAWLFWLPAWIAAWDLRELNRADPMAEPFATLGWANRLTMLRGLLLGALAGFILQPAASSWLPALCCAGALALDRIDGMVARQSGKCSLFGLMLSRLYDAVALVIVPLVALCFGKLHESYMLTGVAYFAFVAGSYWRTLRNLPVAPLLPSPTRRLLRGAQMGFAALLLCPPFAAPLTRWLGLFFMTPFLLGYMLDWWQVSGVYDPQSPINAARRQTLDAFVQARALPALRLLLALWLLTQPFGAPIWLSLPLALSLALGLWTRVGAALFLLTLALSTGDGNVSTLTLAACASAVALLLYGGGAFSLHRGDEAWLRRVLAA
ncbi:MAG: hypothetical protein LBE21_10875 [Pseudomonadales bacterium]|jgi:CDP-diacylglycerol--glycerol-3-phosphate 3-phosphatidyltransferase|nr:hypothetical protein [Pseudomonadales bacterium]